MTERPLTDPDALVVELRELAPEIIRDVSLWAGSHRRRIYVTLPPAPAHGRVQLWIDVSTREIHVERWPSRVRYNHRVGPVVDRIRDLVEYAR